MACAQYFQSVNMETNIPAVEENVFGNVKMLELEETVVTTVNHIYQLLHQIQVSTRTITYCMNPIIII